MPEKNIFHSVELAGPSDLVPWDTFSQFGLAGMVLGVMLIVIVMYNMSSRKMNHQWTDSFEKMSEAWRDTFESHADRADRRQAETNSVLRDLSKTMQKL